MPEMDIIGIHKKKVLIVVPGDHRVTAVYFTRKQSHPFINRCPAVQSNHFKTDKIFCLHYLRQDRFAVICCIGSIVFSAAVIILKKHETRIFHAVLLAWREWKQNAFRKRKTRVKGSLVITSGKP